jgi:hypothetical protein
MRNLIVLFLMLLAFGADGQRRRTTAVFDGDIWTRPPAANYGIGVRLGQPYLVLPENDPMRIKVEHAYIVGVQLNENGSVEYPGGTYQGRRTELVTLNKDSLTVTLPNPRDSINNLRLLNFIYLGYSGELFNVFDSTYAVRFSDTVFAYNGTDTFFFLPNTWMGSMTTNPSHIARSIVPNGKFQLRVYDRRWYISFNGVEY